MASENRTIEISAQVFELLCRGAALDRIEPTRYLEILVMRDARYIRTREFLEGTSSRRPDESKKDKKEARLAA